MQRQAALAEGKEPPQLEGEAQAEFGTPDELITTIVDVSEAWEAKKAAIFAHQSQMANFDFLKMDQDLVKAAFGVEHFVRRFDRTGAPLPESDLFAGIESGVSSG
jgi:LmbE family N-acetylglucosaminyl deacetylase